MFVVRHLIKFSKALRIDLPELLVERLRGVFNKIRHLAAEHGAQAHIFA